MSSIVVLTGGGLLRPIARACLKFAMVEADGRLSEVGVAIGGCLLFVVPARFIAATCGHDCGSAKHSMPRPSPSSTIVASVESGISSDKYPSLKN
jgi:hypothetical protein